MGVLSIREYANNHGISYEAVRKQVIRHQDELKKHITVKNRTKYLDETAQDILDKYRMSNPVVILEDRMNTEYKELTEKLEEKNLIIQELQKQLLEQQEQLMSQQQQAIQLIEYKTRLELLEESRNELKDENKQLQEVYKDLNTKLEIANHELNAYKPSILGFYRKK